MPKQISFYVVGLAGLLFLGLCFLAYTNVGLSGFDLVLAQPWGLVTLADVSLGGVCIGAVIFAFEKDKKIAVAWTAPIFLLGHVVSVAWLLVRFLPKQGANQSGDLH